MKSVQNQQKYSDFSSFSSKQQNYQYNPITFPPTPRQMQRLYEIYMENQQKITSLHLRINQLKKQRSFEQILANDMKIKSNQTFDEIEMIEEAKKSSPFIEKYEQQSKQRNQQHQNLLKLYGKLRTIFVEENMIHDSLTKNDLRKQIYKTREVIQYSNNGNQLICLTKKRQIPEIKKVRTRRNSGQPDLKEESNNSQLDILNKSTRSQNKKITKDKDKQQNVFTIRMLSLKKILHQLSTQKSVHTEQIQTNDHLKYLENSKSNAQLQLLQDFFLNEKRNKNRDILALAFQIKTHSIYLLDFDGNIIFVQQDKKLLKTNAKTHNYKEVILFESYEQFLYVASSDGVVTIYKQQKELLTPVQIFACFLPPLDKENFISHIALVKQNQSKQLVSSILYVYRKKKLLHLRLSTKNITQLFQSTDPVLKVFSNCVITPKKIYLSQLKPQNIQFNATIELSQNYFKEAEQVIGFWIDKSSKKMLLADKYGSLRLVTI